jgi:hypothetical protein
MRNLLRNIVQSTAIKALATLLTATRSQNQSEPNWGRFLIFLPAVADLEHPYSGCELDQAALEEDYRDMLQKHRQLLESNEKYRNLFNRISVTRHNFHGVRENWNDTFQDQSQSLRHTFQKYAATMRLAAGVSGLLLAYPAGRKMFNILESSASLSGPAL